MIYIYYNIHIHILFYIEDDMKDQLKKLQEMTTIYDAKVNFIQFSNPTLNNEWTVIPICSSYC